jgi:hypothetical protein
MGFGAGIVGAFSAVGVRHGALALGRCSSLCSGFLVP